MRILVAVLIFFVWVLPSAAQEEPEFFPLHQVTVGAGTGSVSEGSVFNITPDVKGAPDFFFDLAYLYHVSPSFGVGMSLVGYSQSITEVTVILSDGSTARPEFDLSLVHFAAVGRYTFAEGGIKPYVFGMISLVTGSVSSKESGTLNQLGFGAGEGIGVSFDIGSHVRLSAEGLGVFGSSSWKERPFLNSSGTDYNPGMAGVLVNLSYLWSD